MNDDRTFAVIIGMLMLAALGATVLTGYRIDHVNPWEKRYVAMQDNFLRMEQAFLSMERTNAKNLETAQKCVSRLEAERAE